MTDHFATLDEPRRPWLEPEALKEKFLRLSATVHPDRAQHLGTEEREAAQQRYTELNAAHNCLREPRLRVRHLLELETGAKPSDLTQVPEDLMALFFETGKTLREVDAFLAEQAGATSPLLKVQLFERAMDWTETLTQLLQRIHARRDELVDKLKVLDSAWSRPATGTVMAQLETLYRLFSYYDRWLAQLQERSSQLAC